MRYITSKQAKAEMIQEIIRNVESISKRESVIVKQRQEHEPWERNGQVQVGQRVYNVGTHILGLWRQQGLVRGEGDHLKKFGNDGL